MLCPNGKATFFPEQFNFNNNVDVFTEASDNTVDL
jgi:hypothetical protein